MERNIGGIREEKINVEMITFRGHEMLCYVLKILILEDDEDFKKGWETLT